jgi:hypothetical protein
MINDQQNLFLNTDKYSAEWKKTKKACFFEKITIFEETSNLNQLGLRKGNKYI